MENGPLSRNRSKLGWPAIRNYLCTYAPDRSLDLSWMSAYDAMILEPEAVSLETLEAIRKRNPDAFLIGYLSVGETHTLRRDPGGHPLDIYFTGEDGKPVQNPSWGSCYVDAGKPLWHQLVLEIDAVFPDKLLLMNRGFHLLQGGQSDVSASIDGILFESYTATWYPDYHLYPPGENDYNWTEAVSDRLNAIRWRHNPDGTVMTGDDGQPLPSSTPFNVLAHDYAAPSQLETMQQCVDRAYARAFVPSLGTKDLTEAPYDWRSLVAPKVAWGSALDLKNVYW
ncbi:hypothetical protein [Anaerotalea alkaliphila]|uniref:Uncharacterized protein n=1 Tax=Anaerotalea alkaliphila TaxID=2662126 RepID=A0A7X5HWC6_9FIRM|nr:hypothetical protein [Anaerotalea alkaliphila]NDL67865.1 hypothetical protein [Anaerotalea alkaliphila]